jgi:hypothetical protein
VGDAVRLVLQLLDRFDQISALFRRRLEQSRRILAASAVRVATDVKSSKNRSSRGMRRTAELQEGDGTEPKIP